MEDESSLSAQLEQERKRRLIAEQQLQEQSAALAAAQAALHTLAADVEARVHARTAELSAHAASKAGSFSKPSRMGTARDQTSTPDSVRWAKNPIAS